MALVLSLITSLISLVFALTVLAQYMARRRPYQLVWSVGLFLYFAGTGVWFLREALGINQWILRAWYFTGAMLVPAYLGTGTLYLLAPRRAAHTAMGILLVATVAAGILAFVSPLQRPVAELAASDHLTGVGFFPPYVFILTIVLNTYGTIALVGGALWSAALFLWRRAMPRRALSNVLIAVGALFSAAGGALARLDIPQPHLIALLIGIIVIYLGFLLSREVFEFRLGAVRGR
jgi:hypothetical protein